MRFILYIILYNTTDQVCAFIEKIQVDFRFPEIQDDLYGMFLFAK